MDDSATATRDMSSLEAQVQELMVSNRGREAVDLVVAAASEDPTLAALAVAVRHRAAVATSPARRPASVVAPADDPFPAPGIPEVPMEDLTASLLDAALTHRGSLLVRGFFSQADAAAVLADVTRAFEAATQSAAGAGTDVTAPWYVPFEAEPGYTFGGLERTFTRDIGGVLSVESPQALASVIANFKRIGFDRLLMEYFGETPMISAKKSTLRRATPTSPTEWHQDGAFLGAETRTVNAWVALTACGVDAPGIDVVPKSFDHIVETGTDQALFHWSVSPEQARRVASTVVTPSFEAGDALLFNHLTLHRSAIRPTMTRDRYAIESWFFAPSSFPYEQIPILF